MRPALLCGRPVVMWIMLLICSGAQLFFSLLHHLSVSSLMSESGYYVKAFPLLRRSWADGAHTPAAFFFLFNISTVSLCLLLEDERSLWLFEAPRQIFMCRWNCFHMSRGLQCISSFSEQIKWRKRERLKLVALILNLIKRKKKGWVAGLVGGSRG